MAAFAKVRNFSGYGKQLFRQMQPHDRLITPYGSIFFNQRSSHWNKSGSSELPRASYGGWHTVTMIPGDGVGPELMGHVKQVFRYAGVPVEFEDVKLDQTVTDDSGMNNALLSIKRNGIALKGNIQTKLDVAAKSRNVEMRSELDIFANVIRCKSIPALDTRHKNIDIIVIRENTEGEYSSLEHESVPGVVESLKIITEYNSKRIAKYAFDYATKEGRKKVTCVHKANIMKLADGLFMESCREVSKHYPNIEFETMIVDNCCMQMVSNPQQFDVMVLPNLYGNIVANIGAALVGGSGVVAGSNIGENYAIFEMGTRPTGKAIEGLNIANPTAMLFASAAMLEHIGLTKHAKLIRTATTSVLCDDKVHTPDIGGQASTAEVVQAIINRIKETSHVWL